MDGWIKLHRKLMESETFSYLNAIQKLIAIYIILNANHKDGIWIDKYRNIEVPIKRGQLITSRQKIKKEWFDNDKEITDRKIRTTLEKLEKLNFLTKETTNSYSLITVLNYDIYQAKEIDSDQQIDQEPTKRRPANDQQTTLNKNDKNDKNDKNEKNINNITLQILDLRSRYSEKQLQIIDEYFDILKWTRRTGKIADSVILKIYKEWEKYPVEKVMYALHVYINNPKLHDKKENYCYGIMRNATMEEIEEYKRKQRGASNENNIRDISRGPTGPRYDKQSQRVGKFDNIEIPGIITG